MKRCSRLIGLVLLVVLAATSVWSIPPMMNIQGNLTNAVGDAVADGDYGVTFRIYDAENGGNEIWSETIDDVSVSDGLFSVLIGAVNPLTADVFDDDSRWLGIQLDGEAEMVPRNQLVAVPWAERSSWADTALVAIEGVESLWQRAGDNVYVDAGRVGIGTSNPGTYLHVHSDDNQGAIKVSGASDGGLTYSGIYLEGSNPGSWENCWVLAHKNMAGSDQENALVVAQWLDGTGYTRMLIQKDGDVGIGTSHPEAKLHINGRTKTSVLEITGGADLAEPFPITDASALQPGAVVVIDKDNPGNLRLASKPYDSRVAGIVSGAGGINPGITLVQEGVLEQGHNVALSGRVYALASTVNGPIQPGDPLTTSPISGHVMKATDPDQATWSVVGKAMTGLDEGEGLVLVLVNLQ